MPTYSARNLTPNRAAAVGHGLGNNLKVLEYFVDCPAAPTTSDPLQFGWPPANFVLLRAVLESDDLDTAGSPTITLNIGDAGSATRLFSAATVAQTGAAAVADTAAVAGYTYDGATLVTGVAAANATTGAAGQIRLWLIGFIKDPATS